ncbi:UNVERIFIED_CONTAM: Rho GDP-dissociation inhibitor 1 [Sesamum angustifolium]|uniref:Rho GDP-dissociation inhibitor 1 n=1 Tax=Sesamum angustifolium TaxID=2727405 RepID=A0AAW2PAF5_9LAMI
MSLAVGAVSSSKSMGFDENKGDGKEGKPVSETGPNQPDPEIEPDTVAAVSRQMSENSLCTTEDEEDEDTEAKIELGPQCTLKELSEKDKDDESLRRWKEQLLGSVDMNSVGETLDPDVKIFSLAIKSPVDNTKEMIGTFSPQPEPYKHEMPEEATPSGMFARGTYSAKTQFLDDDNRCYLELNYTFEIKKDWQPT